jgi:glycosyltransferase involved in cell wall biosynthesis
MRALFFGDSPHRVGGAQKSLLAALRQVHRFGVEPIVVFPAGGDAADLYREAGLDVRVLPSPPAVMTFGKALLKLGASRLARVMARELLPYSLELARLAKSERCEVLHFNSPRGLCVAGWAASISRLPAVLHLRGHGDLGRAVWLACQLLADEIIVVAPSAYAMIAPSRRDRCSLVYNGVAVPPPTDRGLVRQQLLVDLARSGHDIPDDAPLFASLSALVPFKGIHHLLTAAAAATGAAQRAHYILAGTGLADGYEVWLAQRAVQLGIGDRVHFIGHTARVSELLTAADCLLLTSVVSEDFSFAGKTLRASGEEGLPRSILESLAHGTPVITTDAGGVRDQVDEGITGLFVPPSDPKALTSAIERMVSDADLRARAAVAGPEKVQRQFSVDAAARGLACALGRATDRAESWPARALVIAGVLRDLSGRLSATHLERSS